MKDNTRIFKPWLILPPKVLAALLMILALAALGAGVYTGFFATKGFKSTTATIERIEEDETFVSADPNDKHYIAYVTYTVDGKAYTEALDSYSPSYEVGKAIKVKYDPADPATVRDASLGFSLYLRLHHGEERPAAQRGEGGQGRGRRTSAPVPALP